LNKINPVPKDRLNIRKFTSDCIVHNLLLRDAYQYSAIDSNTSEPSYNVLRFDTNPDVMWSETSSIPLYKLISLLHKPISRLFLK